MPVKAILALVGFVLLLLIGSCSLDRVSPGYVGVKVNKVGSEAGVEAEALGVGWYVTPPGTNIYEFPIFVQNESWKYDEASGVNNRFSFQDKTGLSVSADVNIAYRTDPAKAAILFQTYRLGIDGVVNGALRNAVRNAIVARASALTVDEIYGPGKAKLIELARQDVNKVMNPKGLIVEQLYWGSDIILPKSIQTQINARVANEQAALADQAKVASAKARSDSKIAEAQGTAEALRIEGEALKENAGIAELRAIEKWDGHLPTTMPGQALPFIGKSVK